MLGGPVHGEEENLTPGKAVHSLLIPEKIQYYWMPQNGGETFSNLSSGAPRWQLPPKSTEAWNENLQAVQLKNSSNVQIAGFVSAHC